MLGWERAFNERYEYGFADFDERTGDILNFHAMLERELDLFIGRALPRADRLHGLGFGHKIGIWAACLSLSNELVDPIRKSLVRFNDLRNSVAHGDSREEVDKRLAKLVAALPPAAKNKEPTLDDVGGFLLGTIAITAAEHISASNFGVDERN